MIRERYILTNSGSLDRMSSPFPWRIRAMTSSRFDGPGGAPGRILETDIVKSISFFMSCSDQT